MHVSTVEKPSRVLVIVTSMKGVTLERSLDRVNIVAKPLPISVGVTLMKEFTLEGSLMHVRFVENSSSGMLLLPFIKCPLR